MDVKRLANENQRIKIVPSFEEYLRSIGLNVELEQPILEWFTQLLRLWRTWRKSAAVDNHFKGFFKLTADPFRVVLILIIKGDDSKDCKPKTLPYYVAEELRKWSQQNEVFPDDSLKLPAFQIATHQRNQSFLNLMVHVYYLHTIKDTIVPLVKEMIKNDNCKQASQIVIAMELFEDIPVEDLLFPLILQDKHNMIDEYLCQCPSQAKQFVLFIDSLLNKKFNIREYAQNYVEEKKVCHVKYDKLHSKPLGKLVARLCNKFNIPIETCKNLSKNRTTGGLKYMIHQRYVEHNVSPSVWDDLVKDSLEKNADSGIEFIEMLIDHDLNEALKWAAYINIPESDLPSALKNFSLKEVPKEENWDEEPNSHKEYYKLPLSDSNIVMIDTSEKFYDLMITQLADHALVSIDCEWKPSFGASQSIVALVQVATIDYVYLIDTALLGTKEYTSLWQTFYKNLLDNAEIIKLGFGLEQDLREMKTSIFGLSNIKVKGEGLLDIGLLWKNLVNCGLTLPFTGDSNRSSLSCLVQSCFRLPLEKAEQCSNWEIRPLRHTQKKYAALDAYVLIELYNYFQKLCLEQDLNFEEICNSVMLEKKVKFTKKIKGLMNSSTPLKSAKDIKFFVDYPLGYIAPYLRYCGIDVICKNAPTMWHDMIDTAIAENRCVLVSKMKHTPTSKYSQNLILDVGYCSVLDQLQKIFVYFNINIEPQNIFSRCLNCNEENMKKLSANEAISLCNHYQSSRSTTMYGRRYSHDEDDVYRNFVTDSDDEDNTVYQPVDSVNITTPCVTASGVPITINNVDELLSACEPAVLCDSCGNVFWDQDNICKSVKDLVQNLLNFHI